jgi:hypothetical protein
MALLMGQEYRLKIGEDPWCWAASAAQTKNQ